MLKRIVGATLFQIIVMTALVLAGMVFSPGLLEHLENLHYDFWSARFRPPENQAISIVAIDDPSIDQLGDWPWRRSRIARMVELLTSAQAGAQGICLLYTQPDENPGLAEIEAIRTHLDDTQGEAITQPRPKLLEMLAGAQERLDHDAHLIGAVRRAKNTVLPMRFTLGDPGQDKGEKPSGLLIINSLKPPPPAKGVARGIWAGLPGLANPSHPTGAAMVQETFDQLAGKAGSLGHLNLETDPDGVVRRAPLLVTYRGRLFPSMALQLALKQINARLRDLSIGPDLWGRPLLKIKHLELGTDGGYRMLLNHNPQWTRERTYSFARVLEGAIDPVLFRNQIVVMGVTATGLGPDYRVGSHGGVSQLEIMANMLGRILSKVRLSRPSWALALEITALLYFALFLVIFIPRVNTRLGAVLLFIFLITWYCASVGLLLGYGYQIKPLAPAVLACVGFAVVRLTILARTRRTEVVESHKSLGLSYQGQGMLDMAYEKYIQCPVKDASVKNLLYNLGLDFERKRMFNKAVSVYAHIRSEGRFKDIDDRINRLNTIDHPLALTPGNHAGETTIKMDGGATVPTFGRYEILQELGHGAMGTVYLGRDPKINRQVAIKTLEYAQVDDNELQEVKERFFREAEAAGKLSHPNIVSIFDAGEEHDMAYIAMELLSGENLNQYCKPGNLFSLWRVLSIISEVAVALDYAHQKGVVHRDIKPGNIMLLDDGRIKVTDFGIARVIDASQTHTGVILGTPSYMSPEQIAGKKVDGRSDLFTLGIVFYQMLTGVKPFQGDNITAIIYAITRHVYTPLSEILPDLPVCIEEVVDKLLAKGVTKRYQSADRLAKALEACRKAL